MGFTVHLEAQPQTAGVKAQISTVNSCLTYVGLYMKIQIGTITYLPNDKNVSMRSLHLFQHGLRSNCLVILIIQPYQPISPQLSYASLPLP
jgi:hypothetical protein